MTNGSVPALDSRVSWRVLAGAGTVFVFSVPALFGSTFGLFLVPLEQAFGWGRADIAFSLTLTTAVAWLSILLAGWLADHASLRRLLLSGVILGAANLAAFAFMSRLWHFYALVTALAFTSLGASPLILAKLVQGWFDKRLGVALGILFSCVSVGSVLHPLIVTAVIQRDGWRAAFLVLGAMALVGGVLAVVLAIRQRAAPTQAAVPSGISGLQDGKLPMLAFLRNRTWWTLAAWNLLFGFGGGAISIHFAALLHDRGVGATHIGFAVSMIGVSLFAGNLLAGWLVDRIAPQKMAWMLMTLPLAAALMLLFGTQLPVLLMAAAVLGLATGSDGCLGPFLTRHYFGARVYGQATSTQMLAHALGGGLSPWLSGLMRDRTGDYALSLVCAAAAFALAIVAGWLLPAQGFTTTTASAVDEPHPVTA